MPGVGGDLRFDLEPTVPVRTPPTGAVSPANRATIGDLPWDMRKTGSAAIECAFVAAGLLRVSASRPNIWDVAAGLLLVRAAGGEVQSGGAEGWAPLERLEVTTDPAGGEIRPPELAPPADPG